MKFHLYIPAYTAVSNPHGSVKVSMFVSSAVDRGFKRRSGQTKGFNLHTSLHLKARNIGELEQRLFVSESG